jgi:hypothetical protein
VPLSYQEPSSWTVFIDEVLDLEAGFRQRKYVISSAKMQPATMLVQRNLPLKKGFCMKKKRFAVERVLRY